MKKFLAGSLLSLFLTVIPIQSSNAAIGALVAIGNPAAGAKIALSGLAAIGGGFLATLYYPGDCDSGQCLGPTLIGTLVGLVLLDSDTATLQFKKVDLSVATELNLELEDIQLYNLEIDEANLVLEEVVSSLNEKSTSEEAQAKWEEVKEFVSPSTFKVMQAIVSQ